MRNIINSKETVFISQCATSVYISLIRTVHVHAFGHALQTDLNSIVINSPGCGLSICLHISLRPLPVYTYVVTKPHTVRWALSTHRQKGNLQPRQYNWNRTPIQLKFSSVKHLESLHVRSSTRSTISWWRYLIIVPKMVDICWNGFRIKPNYVYLSVGSMRCVWITTEYSRLTSVTGGAWRGERIEMYRPTQCLTLPLGNLGYTSHLHP